MILACDVGGTKTSVAPLVERGDALESVPAHCAVKPAAPRVAHRSAEEDRT